MRVRVREGAVRLDRPGGEERAEEAAAGLELELDDAGGLVRRPVAATGPHWAWTLAIAPPFELEGRRLADFLAWVRRETGWEVRFVDPALEVATADIVLHGSLRGITPDLAPAAVLPTCGLEHAVDQGALVIRAGALARR
jgi:ferric-dicitrate binding protein FerR (iron transport regulator)